jgi:hypothetical protein
MGGGCTFSLHTKFRNSDSGFKGTVLRPSGFFIKTSVQGPLLRAKTFSNINSNSRRNSIFLKCMRCHWHRMHDACGVIGTVCTVKFSNNFERWKSYSKQNGDTMQKNSKMHAVSMTPHAKYDNACTIDERFERSCQPLKGISFKNKYKHVKGLPNKKISCKRCHWHPMHDFYVRKFDHISANTKQISKRL